MSAVLQFAHGWSIQVVVFVVLGAGCAYVKCEALFGQLIHPDTFGDRRRSAIAPPFSPVLAAAVDCPPNSQPEFTKPLKAGSVSKTKTTRNFVTPTPSPAWT